MLSSVHVHLSGDSLRADIPKKTKKNKKTQLLASHNGGNTFRLPPPACKHCVMRRRPKQWVEIGHEREREREKLQ